VHRGHLLELINMREGRGFKEKLRTGYVPLGTCISFSDPTVSELMGRSGLDFLWIDMEHSPMSFETVQGHVMAAELAGAAALVRLPWNDPVVIKRVLDVGADGVIVPMVCTAQDAEAAVAACRYPPHGVRGFGPRRPSGYGREGGVEYVDAANRDIVIAIQVEHRDAVENLDEILGVPGIDALMVGPADLSASVGLLPRISHARVEELIHTVIAKACEYGVAPGIFAGDVESARRWIAQGMRWINIGWDVGFLVEGIDQAVQNTRAGIEAWSKS
jgi:2-keto-3-deoxy-L-rhamnonate aldolase RhmA